MIISQPNLQFFFTGVETRFWTAYSNAEQVIQKLATEYPVGTEQWVSGWIGMLDRAREWLGARVVRQPAPQTYLVPIQNFELTEGIDRFKLEDDTYGIYMPTIAMMGENMAKWPDWELRDLLQDRGSQVGTRQNGLDQLTHWNTAHPVDFYDASKGTYSNDFRGGFTVNGINVGGALSIKAFSTLWEEIASRKSENNEALGIMADLTVVPTQLTTTAKVILNSMFFAPPQIGNIGSGSGANAPNVGATDNPLKGSTDLLTWPDLANDPTTWYQLVTKKPVKPFSWLKRQAPNFVYRIDPKDPVVFNEHMYIYGSEARGAPAWGFAWLSAISGP